MCLFFSSFSVCRVVTNFAIFQYIKVDQCRHLAAETGSWFYLIFSVKDFIAHDPDINELTAFGTASLMFLDKTNPHCRVNYLKDASL